MGTNFYAPFTWSSQSYIAVAQLCFGWTVLCKLWGVSLINYRPWKKELSIHTTFDPPLVSPDTPVKRFCFHFSHIATTYGREEAFPQIIWSSYTQTIITGSGLPMFTDAVNKEDQKIFSHGDSFVLKLYIIPRYLCGQSPSYNNKFYIE